MARLHATWVLYKHYSAKAQCRPSIHQPVMAGNIQEVGPILYIRANTELLHNMAWYIDTASLRVYGAAPPLKNGPFREKTEDEG